jgi:hypothetical protein
MIAHAHKQQFEILSTWVGKNVFGLPLTTPLTIEGLTSYQDNLRGLVS